MTMTPETAEAITRAFALRLIGETDPSAHGAVGGKIAKRVRAFHVNLTDPTPVKSGEALLASAARDLADCVDGSYEESSAAYQDAFLKLKTALVGMGQLPASRLPAFGKDPG